MSWSFQLSNGDLNLGGPGGFAVVQGGQKLLQDLKGWILEPQGTDPFHPDFGSTLDGGRLPDGTLIETNIGSTITNERVARIDAELRRVLQAYQQQQQVRLQEDTIRFNGKNTFGPGEILSGVSGVDIQEVGDVLVARITILTDSGNQFDLTTPVG